MEGRENHRDVWAELSSFKRKFYTSQIIKGILLLAAIVLTVFLVINTLEFSFRFGSGVRLGLLSFLLISFLFSFYLFLLDPLLKLIGKKSGMSDEEAAKRIGNSFPSIQDRLLNLIQLRRLAEDNSLLEAGIAQKSQQVGSYNYKSSIKYKDNGKYIKYVLSPVSVIAILLIAYPSFITEPTERIVKFRDNFVPEAPFEFLPQMEDYGFKNEDFTVSLELRGEAFPQNVYLHSNGRKIKMVPIGNGSYEHIFKNLQDKRTFRFEGAGFFSPQYSIPVYNRPNLKNFNVQLNYPQYTGRSNERLSNIGNLEIPEGTKVGWQFSTVETESLEAFFLSDSSHQIAENSAEGLFEINKTIYDSDNYLLGLLNKYSKNKDLIRYSIRVIKDQYPEISLSLYQDTVLYSMVALGGNLTDDYGISALRLHYTITDDRNINSNLNTIDIPINKGQANQGFYYQWEVDSMILSAGSRLSYYLEVWDNDAINGRKSSKTGLYQFEVPTRAKLKEELDQSTENTEDQLQKSVQESKLLEQRMKEAEERMKGKKNFDWEDEKLLKEILDKREELEKALKELQEKNRNNQMQRDRFSPQDQKQQEKSRQLQNTMEQLMDEETRRLFEELQNLMEEKSGVEQMQRLMEQLNRRQNNFQKELERTMELFKRLKLENEISEVVNEMQELSIDQFELSEETLKEGANPPELLEEQEELIDRFNKLKEDLEGIDDLNKELDNPEEIPDQADLKSEIEKDQAKSKALLEKMVEEMKKGQEGEKQGEEQQAGNEKEEGENKQDASDQEKKEGENSQEEGDKKEGNKEEEAKKENTGENQEQTEKQESGDESQQESSQEQSQQKSSPRNQASDSQKKAGKNLKSMSEEMAQAQAGMEMQMMEANIDDLRNILHNLLKLSFDQEDLMGDFRNVNESDPNFVPLSQNQLKLRDDARVLQDSLYSLAGRVPQLEPIITREVNGMNEHMENAMNSLKERRKFRAVSEQQFAMTSMNNLALMLDDVLNSMMNTLSSSKGQKKGNKRQNEPSLGEMQQKLNEQVQELKGSGKTGRELSEELAKLAAEQARIRRALEEMQQRMENMDTGGNSSPGGDIPKKMEDSELDLVNKKLTEQLIRRQQDILTRLLEAENAMRERELDDERKGETARDYDKIIPRSFDEYLKQKEQEIEMLKTLPPKLYPYYKKEVSDYFKRIGEGQN